MPLENIFGALALEETLQAILTELTQKLEAGQTVVLDATTLAALENINAIVTGSVSVSNFPSSQAVTGPLTNTQLRASAVPVSVTNPTADPETGLAKESTLNALLVEMREKLETGQTVTLDASTLAALETINVGNFPAIQDVRVTNPTENPEVGLAKEDTLAALLTELGQKLEQGQAVALDTETLAALEAISVANFPTTQVVEPIKALKVEQQRVFIVASGRLSIATSGFFRALFTNPAGSGRTMRIDRIAAFVSQGPGYLEIYKNPTDGIPATAIRPVTNVHLGAVFQSVAELRADVSQGIGATGLSGGTNTGWVFGMPGAQRTTLDLPPIVLPAGTSLGFNLPSTGASDATLSIYFVEE